MGTIFLLAVSTFVFTIWPLKKVATWLGAEKDSYGAVIFALFLSFVLCILAAILSIPLAFLGTPGFIGIVIIFIFAIGTAYSKALVTPFWNGVGIAVFAAIFGAGLQLIFAMIFGVSIFPEKYEGEVSVAAIENASEDVCKCAIDRACMEEKMNTFAQIMQAAEGAEFSEKENRDLQKTTARVMKCMMEPGEYVPPKKKRKEPKTDTGSVPVDTMPQAPSPVLQETVTPEPAEEKNRR